MPQKFITWDTEGIEPVYSQLEKLMDRPSPEEKVTIANHHRVINEVITAEIEEYERQFINK